MTRVAATDGRREAGAAKVVMLEAREEMWEIAPGRSVAGFTFNHQVPGPTIEARVGEELIVRLTNGLNERTIIHWHGLRVPAEMDGTELVQRLVEPGETFEYRIIPPDAGTFWYHSHANETEQLEKGLYGALIVRGEHEPTTDGERVLVFDDLKLNRQGKVARFGGFIQRHNGREGNTLLLNGRTDRSFSVAAGQIERWRLINAASARFIRLSIGGTRFELIGSDGGLLPAPVPASEVLLTPGERVDLAVGPFEEGAELAIESLPYARGTIGRAKDQTGRFATVRVGPAKPSRAQIPSRLRVIEPLVTGAVEPNRKVRLGGRPSLRRGVDWTVDDERHHTADPVRVGELQVWDIVNESEVDHPFHLHGFFFQVLEEDGKKSPALAWKDTVNVPSESTVRIAWMPDDRPGLWMYHCHILEHHQAGMMAMFEVVR